MTGMVTVRLVLYGLIAFVPNAKDSPSAVSALLVDARGPQYVSDGCRIPPHRPVLYASAGKCRDNGGSCKVSSQVEKPGDAIAGAWPLDGQSLSVEIIQPGGQRVRKRIVLTGAKIASPLPTNPSEGSSVDWVPQVGSLLPAGAPADAGEVSEDCLGSARDCPIAARVTLDAGQVTSCHLAADEYKLIYPFRFKSLVSNAESPLVQAMSDALMATFQVPRGSKIKIDSRNLADAAGRKPRRSIVLEDRGLGEIDVWITNLPPYHHQMAKEDECHDMDVDRHFELYYNLLKRRLPFTQRVVPSRVRDGLQPKLSSQVQPSGGEICPLLVFYDDDGKVPNDWKSCGNIQLAPPSSSNP